MVSTRNHPSQFPPPPETPGGPARSPTKSKRSKSPESPPSAGSYTNGVTNGVVKRSSGQSTKWAHQPTSLSIIWLAISVPLVLWDTGFIYFRPRSFYGGDLHWLWKPYKLYSTIDLIYSEKAFADVEGFTGAQAMCNLLESILYTAYIAIIFAKGNNVVDNSAPGILGFTKRVEGVWGARCVVIGLIAITATVSKTLLYMFVQVCNGFSHVKHNEWDQLIKWFILPNFPWIIIPSIVGVSFYSDIVDALSNASVPKSKLKSR